MKTTILYLSTLFLLFTACEKREVDNETQSAIDNAEAEMKFADVTTIVNHIGLDEDGVEKGILNGCPDITVEIDTTTQDSFPKTYTLNYGQGCTGNDGRMRAGELVFVFSNSWMEDEVNVNVSFNDYKVAGINHLGNLSVVKTLSTNGHKLLEITLTEGKLEYANGDVVNYETTRTIEQTEGESTNDTGDDTYVLNGSAKGVSRTGREFNTFITTPLVRKMTCGYIAEGVIELSPKGFAKRMIDFGDGTCDNLATVTINDSTFEIELP